MSDSMVNEVSATALVEKIQRLERFVAELQDELQRTRHEFIEDFRYVLEAGGDHVIGNDPLRGEHLRAVGHLLPYLLSGRRHWSGPELQGVTRTGVSDLGHVEPYLEVCDDTLREMFECAV